MAQVDVPFGRMAPDPVVAPSLFGVPDGTLPLCIFLGLAFSPDYRRPGQLRYRDDAIMLPMKQISLVQSRVL
jgi:hypothetical protein